MPQQGGDHTVFHDLSFHVDTGEVVDITGPSGAGKSTLLTAFARLNAHTTGTFALDGKDSDSFTPQQWRVRVSYLPQTSTLIGDTVADVIRLPWTLAVRQGESVCIAQPKAHGVPPIPRGGRCYPLTPVAAAFFGGSASTSRREPSVIVCMILP